MVVGWFTVSERRSRTSAASESSSPEAARSSKSRVELEVSGSWEEQTARSLREGSGGHFAQQMQKASMETIIEISTAILSAHEEQPDRTILWLEELSVQLAFSKAHAQAALLLDLLSPFEETSTIESKIFSDWILTDSEGALSFFQRLAEEDEIPHSQLSVVAALFQGAHTELFDTYYAWIEQSDMLLQGSLVEALVPHLLPENMDSVTDIILSNLASNRHFEVALFKLVEVRSPEDPAKSLEWLSQLDLDEVQAGTQVAAFGAAIQHIARSDVDAAAQILSQEDFLPKYFPAPQEELVDEEGNWSGKARWFFDEVLRHFIEEIQEADLELARNSVESYFDPLRREEYRLIFNEQDAVTE